MSHVLGEGQMKLEPPSENYLILTPV